MRANNLFDSITRAFPLTGKAKAFFVVRTENYLFTSCLNQNRINMVSLTTVFRNKSFILKVTLHIV